MQGYGAFSPEPHRVIADCEPGVWLLTRTLSASDRTVLAVLRDREATDFLVGQIAFAPFPAVPSYPPARI